VTKAEARTRLSLLEQIRFTARLRLLSDLHTGTGGSERLKNLRDLVPSPDDDADDGPLVALIFRDNKRAPAIPATALKGALRKAVRQTFDEHVIGYLFGEIKDTEWQRDDRGAEEAVDAGGMGCVWLRMARLAEAPAHPGTRPYWDEDASSMITTHVAIDRKTGTADDKKLFYVERVPAGACFELRGVFLGNLEEAEKALALAFAPLARAEGLGIGADERFGAGRLRLEGALQCTRWWFDPGTGEIRVEEVSPISILSVDGVRGSTGCTLELYCRGPYLTVDPARQSRNSNLIPTLKRDDDTPDLPATSLMGALRERAAWLAALDPLAAEEQDAPDDRFRKTRTWSSPGELTRVERLFGVAGWRGLVRVVAIESLDGARLSTLTSVCLDRFSGAPLDSALFDCEAFIGARFQVTLSLDERSSDDRVWPSEADRALFDALIDEVRDDGLLLGHATGRGFGWFNVKEIVDTAGGGQKASAGT
jgi:CRISPR/Cas system CMR subunit Cmr4 (Cas7 group RAMP superfamily)